MTTATACYSPIGTAMSDDSDLLERLGRGDPGAVELLMTLYADRVYRLAYGVTRNQADAQEILKRLEFSSDCPETRPNEFLRFENLSPDLQRQHAG